MKTLIPIVWLYYMNIWFTTESLKYDINSWASRGIALISTIWTLYHIWCLIWLIKVVNFII